MRINKTIISAIDTYMTINGLSQADLGKKVGVSQATVGRWLAVDAGSRTIRNSHWCNLYPLIKDHLPNNFEGEDSSETIANNKEQLRNYFIKSLGSNSDFVYDEFEPEATAMLQALYGRITDSQPANLKDPHLYDPGMVYYVPLITQAQAKSWDCSEVITESINPNECQTVPYFGKGTKDHLVAIRVNGDSMGSGLPHGSIIFVDMYTPYPNRGKRVLAKLNTGELVVKRYNRKDNVITLTSDGEGLSWEWHTKNDQSPIEWMRPVKKILIDED